MPATDRSCWRLTVGVFLVALAVYTAVVFLVRLKVQPTGDEPHYIAIAQTFAKYRQLDIRATYNEPDFQRAYAVGPSNMHPRGAEEEHPGWPVTSFHIVGLPALLTPPYYLALKAVSWLGRDPIAFPYYAVLATLVLISSAGVALLFRFAYELTGSAAAAVASTGLIAFTNPMLFYSSQVSPETVGSVVLVACLWLAWRAPRRPIAWLAVGLGLAYLPWLHLRYIPLAGILGLYALYRAWPLGPRAIAAIVVPCAVTAVGVPWYSWIAWASWNPYAVYRPSASTLSTPLLTGLFALFVEQTRGLFSRAPIYVVAVAALLLLTALRPLRSRAVLLPTAAMFAFIAAISALYRDWDGGYAPPPRYLVPVLPLLAVPLALALGSATRARLLRPLVALLGLWSFVAASYPFRDPHLQFFELDAASPLLAAQGRDLRNLTGLRLTLHDAWPMYRQPPFVYSAAQRRSWGGVGHNEGQDGTPEMPFRIYVDNAVPGRSTVFVHDPKVDKPGLAAWGQYLTLPSGHYRVEVQLKTPNVGDRNVAAWTELGTNDGRVGREEPRVEIRGSDFARPNEWQSFGRDFYTDGLLTVELRVVFTGAMPVTLGTTAFVPQSR